MQLLSDCAAAFEHKFEFRELAFGGAAIDRFGNPLPEETLAGCRSADAILLGAIGGPKWDPLPLDKASRRPACWVCENSLVYTSTCARFRCGSALQGISPLRRERISGCDFEIVRELAGDIYFGEHAARGRRENASARDVASYTAAEVERVARYAFDRAAARNRHVTSVDKANVLATSVLWRKTVTARRARISGRYARSFVRGQCRDADSAAPAQFDVILTGNMFGDILSDEAAALAGSIGLIPSMSRGLRTGQHSTSLFTVPLLRLREKTSLARWAQSIQRHCCCGNLLALMWRRNGSKRPSIAFWIMVTGPWILQSPDLECCAARNLLNKFALSCMNRWFTRKDMDGESESQSDLDMTSHSLLDEP